MQLVSHLCRGHAHIHDAARLDGLQTERFGGRDQFRAFSPRIQPELLRRDGGEADVRLDYRGDEAPSVEWRDTFADEVQRLDRDTVLGCLRAGLGATRRTIDAERLLVSFRFSME